VIRDIGKGETFFVTECNREEIRAWRPRSCKGYKKGKWEESKTGGGPRGAGRKTARGGEAPGLDYGGTGTKNTGGRMASKETVSEGEKVGGGGNTIETL